MYNLNHFLITQSAQRLFTHPFSHLKNIFSSYNHFLHPLKAKVVFPRKNNPTPRNDTLEVNGPHSAERPCMDGGNVSRNSEICAPHTETS